MCTAWPTDQSWLLIQKRKEIFIHGTVLSSKDVDWTPSPMIQSQILPKTNTKGIEICTKITGPCPVTFYLLGHDNQDDLQLSQPTWGSFEMSKLVYLCNHLNKKYKTKKLNRKHISIGILWFLYIQVIQKLLLTKIQILN